MEAFLAWLSPFSKFDLFSHDKISVTENSNVQTLSKGNNERKVMRDKQPLRSVCRRLEPVVLVHGGAGNIPDSVVPEKLNCVKRAAIAGYKTMRDGGTPADAVEAAIRVMEDDPIMNAGYGSVLNYEGEVEADACIMVGKTLDTGGITAVTDIANPISLAKLVMEKSPHTLLAAEGAKKFAEDNKYPIAPHGSLATEAAKQALEAYKSNPDDELRLGKFENIEKSEIIETRLETVGAIAMNREGKMAAGTSTGGVLGKFKGCVGDAPQIGKGAYSDDEVGSVTVTGHAESITKFCLASRILQEVSGGKTAEEASVSVLENMQERLKNSAGVICLTNEGDIGYYWTTPQMTWAYQKGQNLHYGVNPGDHLIEEIKYT